jgi:hypothetical protein
MGLTMWQTLNRGREGLRGLLERAGQLAALVRAQRRQRAAAIVAAAVLIVLLGIGSVALVRWRAGHTPGAADIEHAWRYLVVCEHCGHRERTIENPAREWPKKKSRLKCPACGEFKAAWYRRGSQAVPPGGW